MDVWEMDIRRFGAALPLAQLHAQAHQGGLRDLLRHPLPRPRARGRPAAARLERLSLARRARRRVRREVGLGAGQLVRVQRARGDEALRPRGWAGMHWSPAIGAEHRAAARARRPVRRVLVRQARDLRAGRGRAAGTPVRQPRGARRGAITYTQMLNRRGGIECDFTVTRTGEESFSIVTGTAFGNHDLGWIRRHAPADGSVRCVGRDRALGVLRAVGPARRDILAPLTDDPLDFGYMRMRELAGRRRPGPRPAGDVRRRARLGAVLPHRVRRRRCGATLWEAGREHGCVAGGYRAIDSLRLEKGYRVWAADITADETPLRGRARLLRQGRRRRSSAPRRWPPARPPARSRAAPALPRARRPPLGRARQRAGARRRARSSGG